MAKAVPVAAVRLPAKADMVDRTVRSRTRLALVAFAAAAFAVLANAPVASAHDTTGEGIAIEVNDRRVVVTAAVAFAELGYEDTSGDGLIDATELAEQEAEVAPTLVTTVRDRVGLTVDGEDSELIGAGVPSIGEVGDDGTDDEAASSQVIVVIASGPHDGDVAEVDLAWGFSTSVNDVVLTHPDGVVTGDLTEDGTVEFSLDGWSSAASFFGLGIEHIRFGPDHLLFLLVLTLAVAGTSVTPGTTWRTVKLVTAFTIGHAVSLGLAYFDLVYIPAGIVEPAIALSIVAAAVLAIRGNAREARPWIAAIIGLIHGLGFASSLSSLGVATAQRATALAAFNLGIDVAQTAVVLALIGGLWLVSKALADRMFLVRIPAAAFAGVVGVAWTFSRIAGLSL